MTWYIVRNDMLGNHKVLDDKPTEDKAIEKLESVEDEISEAYNVSVKKESEVPDEALSEYQSSTQV